MAFSIQGNINIIGTGIIRLVPFPPPPNFTLATTGLTSRPIIGFSIFSRGVANSVSLAYTANQSAISTDGVSWTSSNIDTSATGNIGSFTTYQANANATPGAIATSSTNGNIVVYSNVVSGAATSYALPISANARITQVVSSNATQNTQTGRIWYVPVYYTDGGSNSGVYVSNVVTPTSASDWTYNELPTQQPITSGTFGATTPVFTAGNSIIVGTSSGWSNVAVPAAQSNLNSISYNPYSNTFTAVGSNAMILTTGNIFSADSYQVESVAAQIPADATLTQVTTNENQLITTGSVARTGISFILKRAGGPVGAVLGWALDLYGAYETTSAIYNRGKELYGTQAGNIFYQTTYSSSGSFVTVAQNSTISANSGVGLNWFSAPTLPATVYIGAMTYAAGKFVATPYNSFTGYTSTDGNTWTSVSFPTSVQTRDVIYGPIGGSNYFVAVQNSQTGYYSTDGTTWQSILMPTGYYGLATNSSRIVAVGTAAGAYANTGLAFSTSPVIGNTILYWQSSATDGADQFLINDLGRNFAYTNDSGNTWTYLNNRSNVYSVSINSLGYGAIDGSPAWMAMNFGTVNGYTQYGGSYSIDNGNTWTFIQAPYNYYYSPVYDGSKWVAVGSGNSIASPGAVYTDTGVKPFVNSNTIGNTSLYWSWSATDGSDQFLIVNNSNNFAYTNDSGNTWTYLNNRSNVSSVNINSLGYGAIDGSPAWMAMGYISAGYNQFGGSYSTDNGNTWTFLQGPFVNYYTPIYDGSKWVAVGSGNSIANPGAVYTGNGVRPFANSSAIGNTSVFWYYSATDGANQFLICGNITTYTSAGNTFAYTSDAGNTWTYLPNRANARSVSTNAENLTYGSLDGSPVWLIMTNQDYPGSSYSADNGDTWTFIRTPTTNQFFSPIYDGSKFIAVSTGNTLYAPGAVYTGNGILPFANSSVIGNTTLYYRLVATDGADQFLICGDLYNNINTRNNFAYTSDAGTTWTYLNNRANTGYVNSLAYGSVNGQPAWMCPGTVSRLNINQSGYSYSTDNGNTWTFISTRFNGQNIIYDGSKFLAVYPTTANTLGGVSYTTNNGLVVDQDLSNTAGQWPYGFTLNNTVIFTGDYFNTPSIIYSSTGDNNTWTRSQVPGSGTKRIAYDSSQGYVMIGEGQTLVSSTQDFVTYSNTTITITGYDIAYGSGRYVICGSSNSFAYGSTTVYQPGGNLQSGLSFSSFNLDGSTLVVTSGSTPSGSIRYSTDNGSTWASGVSSPGGAFAYTGSAWVSRSGNTSYNSTNLGSGWTSTANVDQSSLGFNHAVSLGGSGALFFSSSGVYYTGSFGFVGQWVQQSAQSLTSGRSQYVNGRVYLTQYQRYSSDGGTSWPTGGPATGWSQMAYGGGIYIAVYGISTTISRSTDGASFTSITIPFRTGGGISYIASQGVFITNNLISTDGLTWLSLGGGSFGDSLSLLDSSGRVLQQRSDITSYITPVTVTTGFQWVSFRVSFSNSYEWRSIIYGGGQFIAVGYRYDSPTSSYIIQAATSPDGITWSERTLPQSLPTTSPRIKYLNGVYVIFSYYASYQYYLTSSDAVTWTARTIPTNYYGGSALGMDFNFINGNYVLITGTTVLINADITNGNTWRLTSNPYSGFAYSSSAVLGNTIIIGGYYRGSYDTNYPYLVRGTTGFSWLSTTSPILPATIAYGGGQYVTIDSAGSNTATSSDGITWTQSSQLPAALYNPFVSYGNGIFLAIGRTITNTYFTSTDGTSWSSRTIPGGGLNMLSLTYSSSLSTWFIGQGYYGSSFLITSSDPTNPNSWYAVNLPASRYVEGIASGSKTIAVGLYYDGYSYMPLDRVSISTGTGTTWLSAIMPTYNTWPTVAFNGSSTYVALSSGSTNTAISSDGITWTLGGVFPASLSNPSIKFGNGLFVAIGRFDATNTYYTSTDGTSWNSRTLSSSFTLRNLDYSSSLGWIIGTTSLYLLTTLTPEIASSWDITGIPKFRYINSITSGSRTMVVGVDYDGYNFRPVNTVFLSTGTGLIWKSAQMPSNSNWRAVAYGDGVYVAIAYNSTATARSTDGITWTAGGALPTTTYWSRIQYGNGLFVAIAGDGQSLNTYATSPDGTIWTGRTLSTSYVMYSLGYSTSLGIWMIGLSNSYNYILATATPETPASWYGILTPLSSRYIQSIAAGNRTMLVGYLNDVSTVFLSTGTGLTWKSAVMPSNSNWRAVAYGDGVYVAIAYNSTATARSTDGITWTSGGALPTTTYWTRIQYGNGLFVAIVGEGNTINTYATSADGGVTWVSRTLASNYVIYTLGYSSSLGIWMIGLSNSYNYILATTTPETPASWYGIPIPAARYIFSIAAGSKVMLVGYSNQVNTVMTGTLGIAFLPTQGTGLSSYTWYAVAYGNNKFVAVAYDQSNIVATSTDGITWTRPTVTGLSDRYWASMAYGAGLFIVIVAAGNPSSVYAISPDGITWTERTLPVSAYWSSIKFGNNTWMIISGGLSTLSIVSCVSTNGVSWAITYLRSSAYWNGLAYGNDRFVALPYSSTAVNYTAPGLIWTQGTLPSSSNWQAVASGGSKVVAVGGSSGTSAASTDGFTWTPGVMPTPFNWNTVVFAGTYFVSLAYGSNATVRSSDGITWARGGNLPQSLNWTAITNGGEKLVALVGSSSNVAAFSQDQSSTWTQTSLPAADYWSSVAYGGNIFVAVAGGTSTTSTRIAYGNGNSWTSGSIASGQWISVAYGNGQFVTVAYNSTRVATSPDGTTWTQRTLPQSGTWYSISYGQLNGVASFVIVGSGQQAVTSTDGITWTLSTLPTSSTWLSITYG